MKSALACGVAAVAVTIVQHPLNFQFDSPNGRIIGRNADHYEANQNEDGTYDFKGSGHPMIIERPAQGVTLSANDASGTLRQLPDHNFLLEKGAFVGAAKMVSDSQAADAYLTANGKNPKPHASNQRNELDSERFDYTGTEESGTLTAPLSLTLTGHSFGTHQVTRKIKGVNVNGPEDFDQTTNIEAAKGNVTFDPQPATPEKQRLKKGDLAGPVKMNVVRSVKGPGDAKAVIDTIDTVSDHVEFDFTTTPRTITATGHVVVTDDDGAYKKTFNAERVVLTVDENMRVTNIHAEGNPGSSTIHANGGRD